MEVRVNKAKDVVALVEFSNPGKAIHIADIYIESSVADGYTENLEHITWADVESVYLDEMDGSSYNMITNNCQHFSMQFFDKIVKKEKRRQLRKQMAAFE